MREKGTLRQCIGKKRHKSLDDADEVAKAMAKKHEKPFRFYYCGICNGYHITSKIK